jgi:cellulose synthase/poly-beta-1,6-N-acetylglucosamine synthase-like glycosyltransferase
MTIVEVLFGALLSYWVVLNLGYLVITLMSSRETHQRVEQARHTDYELIARSRVTIPVSVIMPAYNEQEMLVPAVLSALGSEHPEFEVIVVNDGSTDDTLELAVAQFDLERREVSHPTPLETKPVRGVYRSRRFANLWLIDKENGATADAYNAGVNLARYRYIVQIDADCVLQPDTLLRMMRVVNRDPEHIVGIGGQLRPSNGLEVEDGRILGEKLPPQRIARFQLVEYLSAFLGQRPGWSRLNCVPVVAGGFGAWRKDVVIDLGGYATDVTHPDIELTIAAHELFRRNDLPYRVAYVPDAVVWTEVPSSVKDLQAQRRRWQRVVFEVVWKYRRMLLNPRYGLVGTVGMPYLLVYEALGPFIEAAAYLLVATLAAMGLLDLESVVLFLAVSFGLSIAVRLAGILCDVAYFAHYSRADMVRLLALSFIEPAIRVLLVPGRVIAFFEFATGRKTWDPVQRVGTSGANVSSSPLP